MNPLREDWMRYALKLAALGEGAVEPNPMVGAVVVRDEQIVGEGWHQRFGGPHAEVLALQQAGERAQGADLYVTLEPCCHHGKTPPCTDAVIRSGVRRVIVGHLDPFPAVAGKGTEQLRQAGLTVMVGLLEAEARWLNAPYLKRMHTGKPWVIAKWAMSLDGKLATATGDTRWITGPEARAHAHERRGRVDGILIGIGTALADDPMLTARPAGPRLATRVVLDHHLRLPLSSRLALSAKEVPVWLVHHGHAAAEKRQALAKLGCLCVGYPEGLTADEEISWLLKQMGQARWTNLMVEGGSQVLGQLLAARAIDEVQAYIAPKLIGGQSAPGAIGGPGIAILRDALNLQTLEMLPMGADWCCRGRVMDHEQNRCR